MFLGIDYGQKRIGLAIGSQIPRGLGTLSNPGSFEPLIDKIAVLAKDHDVEAIIIGMPVRTSGERGEIASEIERFGKAIAKKTGLEVKYEEEGYTSVQAEDELKTRGISLRDNKERIDELSAVLILEQYIAGKEREESLSKKQ